KLSPLVAGDVLPAQRWCKRPAHRFADPRWGRAENVPQRDGRPARPDQTTGVTGCVGRPPTGAAELVVGPQFVAPPVPPAAEVGDVLPLVTGPPRPPGGGHLERLPFAADPLPPGRGVVAAPARLDLPEPA